MATAAVKRYWQRVAALGCLICGQPAQIAHMHGPSLQERNPDFLKPKGKKPAWGDWLVAPLCEPHHWLCDNRPRDFKILARASPAKLIDHIGQHLGVDPWAMATALLKPSLARSAAAFPQSADDEPRCKDCGETASAHIAAHCWLGRRWMTR